MIGQTPYLSLGIPDATNQSVPPAKMPTEVASDETPPAG